MVSRRMSCWACLSVSPAVAWSSVSAHAAHDGLAAFGQPQACNAAVAGIGGALDEPGPFHPGERFGDGGLLEADPLDEFRLGRVAGVVDVDDEKFLAKMQAELCHQALQYSTVRQGRMGERVTDRPVAGGDLTPGGHASTTCRSL